MRLEELLHCLDEALPVFLIRNGLEESLASRKSANRLEDEGCAIIEISLGIPHMIFDPLAAFLLDYNALHIKLAGFVTPLKFCVASQAFRRALA